MAGDSTLEVDSPRLGIQARHLSRLGIWGAGGMASEFESSGTGDMGGLLVSLSCVQGQMWHEDSPGGGTP